MAESNAPSPDPRCGGARKNERVRTLIQRRQTLPPVDPDELRRDLDEVVDPAL